MPRAVALRTLCALLGLAALLLAGAALVAWLNLRGEAPLQPDAPSAPAAGAATIARGAYLARAGHCAGCHSARGGAAYAGGRGIHTPFGTVYAGNLTPDVATGLGAWSASQFRRALWHGRSADGRLLVPAFPYTHFTLVTRDDADALWAYLRSLAPVVQANRPHDLRWPYRSQVALAVWRALYFRAGRADDGLDSAASGTLRRGAYLVNGLGHCSACHASRNALGAGGHLAASLGPGGGSGGAGLPGQRWAAPSLTDPGALGVAQRRADELVQLLQTGLSDRAATMGPMAEVVAGSTQHLRTPDLQAMVAYLQHLAATPSAQHPSSRQAAADQPAKPAAARASHTMGRGQQIYGDHCLACHGALGEGAPGIYPALAGNPIVTLPDVGNLVLAITGGGFPPATAGNPRPYGMPGNDLSHDDLAALATWLRASWGHDAPAVSAVQVLLAR